MYSLSIFTTVSYIFLQEYLSDIVYFYTTLGTYVLSSTLPSKYKMVLFWMQNKANDSLFRMKNLNVSDKTDSIYLKVFKNEVCKLSAS